MDPDLGSEYRDLGSEYRDRSGFRIQGSVWILDRIYVGIILRIDLREKATVQELKAVCDPAAT